MAARAVGVTGIRETLPTSAPVPKNFEFLSALLSGTLAFLSIALLAGVFIQKPRFLGAIFRILPMRLASAMDQRETLSYIFLACGLVDEAEGIRSKDIPVSYRETADRLLAHGLRASDGLAEILALKCMMLIPTMAPASRDNVKRALRILAKLSDEQIEQISTGATADHVAWRDRVDELVTELPKQTNP